MQIGNFSAEVVLYQPEIPQNTGNIARTCAALGCGLHLIEPLGFSVEDKYLKRAGMDYWHSVEVTRYPDFDTFMEKNPEGRYFFFSKKVERNCYEARFEGKCYFFFGQESLGIPESLLARYPGDSYRIPMRPGTRSLNLSNTAAIVLYEAFRQNGFPGLV